jgi:hypothetical protein
MSYGHIYIFLILTIYFVTSNVRMFSGLKVHAHKFLKLQLLLDVTTTGSMQECINGVQLVHYVCPTFRQQILAPTLFNRFL